MTPPFVDDLPTRQNDNVWRGLLRWFGSPSVAAVAAISLPISAYYIAHARASALVVAELQAEVDSYTVARVGEALPPLVGYDLRGQRVAFDLTTGDAATLILGVSANCIYCLDMLDTHRMLADLASRAGYRVYWITRDPLEIANKSVYTRVSGQDQFLIEPTHRTYRALGLGFTPQTILVSSDGRIDAAWKGVPEDKDAMVTEVKRAMAADPEHRAAGSVTRPKGGESP
jgi:hypothetical protein